MNNDPQNVCREMDAMIARLLTSMSEDQSFDLHHATGYRIVIDGDSRQPEEPDYDQFPSQDTSEPVTEVHEIGGEVHVVAGLPGISEENLSIQVNGQILTIDAAGEVRTYHTTTEIPPVDPASIRHTLKNGVLEITLKSRAGSSA